MIENNSCIKDKDFLSVIQPSFEYTLKIIDCKWKMKIICVLAYYSIARYGDLKRSIEGITHKMLKMLSWQLKELELDGVVIRKSYDEIPPKVEYYLSEKGESLFPVLKAMFLWGEEYSSIINKNLK